LKKQGLTGKDKDKDQTHKDQDKYKDQDQTLKDKNKDEDLKSVLKDSLRTRTRLNITGKNHHVLNIFRKTDR